MFLMKDQRAECGNGREMKVNKTTDSKLAYRQDGERKEVRWMLKKIHTELVRINKELQDIRKNLEFLKRKIDISDEESKDFTEVLKRMIENAKKQKSV